MIALKILLLVNIVVNISILIKYLNVSKGLKTRNSSEIIFALCFLLYHVTYVLISKIFFPEEGWVENSAPFGLAYGPISYYLIRGFIVDSRVGKKQLLHMLPFCVFWIIHVILLIIRVDIYSAFAETYMRVLYGLIGVSFLIYGAWGWRKLRSIQNRKRIAFYLFLILVVTVLIVFALTFTQSLFNDSSLIAQAQNDVGGFMIYSFMLVLLIFLNFHINSLKSVSPVEDSLGPDKPHSDPVEPHDDIQEADMRYEKSGLSPSDLDRYEIALDQCMKNQKPWLQSDLNLNTLASLLKMPPHHLTQVLNMRKGINFNQYINEWRIEYSCQVLEKHDPENSFEDIGYHCGFNSKTTFYRWFKKIKNMTPLEYRERSK